MSLFSFLWLPFFYLFWRSISGLDNPPGGVWALLFGSIFAIAQFFLNPLFDPGGFGISRWVSGCVDIVTIPASLPFLVYLLLQGLKIVNGTADFANFALIWLIPIALIRALNWISLNDPILLMLVPFLWTTIAVGVSFFIGLMSNARVFVIIPASMGIILIPLAAASSYWAFYVQKTTMGFMFLLAAAIPMLVNVVLSFVKARE